MTQNITPATAHGLLAALDELCSAYAQCNGEDHPAYQTAIAVIAKAKSVPAEPRATIIVGDGTTKEGWRWAGPGDVPLYATPANSRAEQDDEISALGNELNKVRQHRDDLIRQLQDVSTALADMRSRYPESSDLPTWEEAAGYWKRRAETAPANSHAEAIGAVLKELREHFPKEDQNRYNVDYLFCNDIADQIDALLQQEGE